MKLHEDYYVVPRFAWNDFAGSNSVKSGRIICTKKHLFLLVEKEEFAKNLMYDKMKVDNLLNVADSVDIIDFEAELIDVVPIPYIIKIEDLEYFNITNSFIAGGVAYKPRGKDSVGFEVSKRSIRKELVKFYDGITFG